MINCIIPWTGVVASWLVVALPSYSRMMVMDGTWTKTWEKYKAALSYVVEERFVSYQRVENVGTVMTSWGFSRRIKTKYQKDLCIKILKKLTQILC